MPRKKIQEKPLTLSQLTQFYNRTIEPQFQRLEEDVQHLKEKVDQGFDDLYRKFEVLQQEYLMTNEQIKRLTVTVSQIPTSA